VRRRGVQGGRREVPTSRSHPPVLVSLFKGFTGAEPGTTSTPLPHGPPVPWSPSLALNTVRARQHPTLVSFSSHSQEGNGPQWFSSAHCTRRAVTRARRRGRVRAYSRGRVAAGARHETLEKRRCPRMYFLIIDFNDEGSRCQRHLGCWAE